ncbi:N-acetylmuramoyl-L-alanine amidase [Micromonospora sp. NPDC003197]
MRLLWLPEVLRTAGLTVHEVAGWRTRGSTEFDPHGIICHETRGSRTSTDSGEINVLLHGSTTAPPPIAQLYLSRTGDWHIVASGRCNHVLVGWAGPFKGSGNTRLLGIEAQHALGESWTTKQYQSYVRGVAALRRHTGWGIAGHKEHQPGGYGHASSKTDPSFNMDQFRRDVASELAKGAAEMGLGTEQLLNTKRTEQQALADAWWTLHKGNPSAWLSETLARLEAELTQIQANQQAMAGKDWVDEQQIVEGVLAGLGGKDLDSVAVALRAVFGERSAELATKLAAA